MFSLKLLTVSFLVFASNVHAQSDQALQETKALLMDPAQRNAVIQADPKARQADDFAAKAVNGNAAAKNELYGISAQILEQLAQQTGGDPQKMQQLLLEAVKDPKKFMQKLPPSVQSQIKDVADRSQNRGVSSSQTNSKIKP